MLVDSEQAIVPTFERGASAEPSPINPCRQLDYASPGDARTFSRARMRSEAMNFAVGTIMSCGIAMNWNLRFLSDALILFLIVTASFVGSGIASTWLVKLRQMCLPKSTSRRLFVPLLGLLYFPAAHFVAIRLRAYPALGEIDASQVSPLHYLPGWLIAIIVLTFVSRRTLRIGNSWWHWWLAGAAAPLSMLGELAGAKYLMISSGNIAHAMYPTTSLVIASFVALPLFIGVTFVPMDHPTIESIAALQERDEERREQACWLNDLLDRHA